MFEKAYVEISDMLSNKCFSSDNFNVIKNASGDIIKKEDIQANNIIVKYIKESQLNIVGYISEENKVFVPLENKQNGETEYIIAFDPLDGSSNVEFNINCGTIYGLYSYNSSENKIIDIVKAGYCLYGSSTVMVETHYNNVIMKILKNRTFEFCKNIKFNNAGQNKYISINNQKYEKEIEYMRRYYSTNNYKLRWVGTMVADIHRLLLNDGIFFYTCEQDNKCGKIRYYYEAIPMAFILSKCGGVGINMSYANILSGIKYHTIKNIHATTSVILCSKNELKILLDQIQHYRDSE